MAPVGHQVLNQNNTRYDQATHWTSWILADSSGEDTVHDRRSAPDFANPTFSVDLLDRFRATTRLAVLLVLVDDAVARTAGLRRGRGSWVAAEDDEAVQLEMPMRGLGKEHVKVWAEKNLVVIEGEGDAKEADGGEVGPRRYSRRIELAADAFEIDKVTAEMKNGVLKVRVPKVNDEERKDVFHAKIE
ncbi:hypothetical protein ACP70R_015861 [Stipagrostis hirtigluma subsp. patula]